MDNTRKLRHVNPRAYMQLMRLDRPVGTLLLLWPTLAALWMAAEGIPPGHLIVVFAVGTFLMRAAGCVANDYADRHFDGRVKRTAGRPLATGAISETAARAVFVLLAACAGSLLVYLNELTRWLAIGGLLIAVTYPFLKRWTYLPQVALGGAFSWGIIMAFAAVSGKLPISAWLLFLASMLWIVAYDTLYAMVDRDDDLIVGIKSTAILFGSTDRLMVGLLQLSALATLLLLGHQQAYQLHYYLGLAGAASLFAYQQYLIRYRERDACFQAFKNNVWVGFVLFAGVVLETTPIPTLATWLQGLLT